MIETVYLSLGSNMGDREAYLKKALDSIALYRETEITAVSSLFETEPVAMEHVQDTRNFLNRCCAVTTGLDPFRLLELIRQTEQGLGRPASGHGPGYKPRQKIYAPRTIDIDILLFGERILYTKDLILPHPLFHERRFVLEPLSEIAGNAVHPLFRLTVQELKDRTTDRHFVKYFSKRTV